MNEETNVIEEVAVETEAPKKFLVHSRDLADEAVLRDAFPLESLGEPVFVHGLQIDAQHRLMNAAQNGHRIVSTSLPVDIASKLNGGRFTQIRCWNKITPEGGSSKGSMPPKSFLVREIVDETAFEALKATDEYQACFPDSQPDEI